MLKVFDLKSFIIKYNLPNETTKFDILTEYPINILTNFIHFIEHNQISINDMLNSTSKFMIKNHLKNTDICSTISFLEKLDFSLTEIIDSKIIQVNINYKFRLKDLIVYWRSAVENGPSRNDIGEPHIGFDEHSIFKIKRVTNTFMRYPFNTNCLDYDEIGFKNQETAINNCFHERISLKYNTSCCGVSMDSNSNILINYNNLIDFEDRINECNQLHIQSDCYDEYSVTTLIHSYEDDGGYKFILSSIEDEIHIEAYEYS